MVTSATVDRTSVTRTSRSSPPRVTSRCAGPACVRLPTTPATTSRGTPSHSWKQSPVAERTSRRAPRTRSCRRTTRRSWSTICRTSEARRSSSLAFLLAILAAQPWEDVATDALQSIEGYDGDHRRSERGVPVTQTHRGADRGGYPQRCGGGEAFDACPLLE